MDHNTWVFTCKYMDRKILIRTKEDHPEVKRPKETIVESPELC